MCMNEMILLSTKEEFQFVFMSVSKSIFVLYTVHSVHCAQCSSTRYFSSAKRTEVLQTKLSKKHQNLHSWQFTVWIQTSFPDSQFIELSIFPFLSFTHCLVSVVLTRLYLIFLSSGKIHGICTYIYLSHVRDKTSSIAANTFAFLSTSLWSMHVYLGIIYLVRQQN